MNEYLYILGGHNGAERLSSVEFTSLSASGQVGTWEYTTSLPSARDGSAVVIHNHSVYVLGGIDDNGVLNNVDMIQQVSDGRLGFTKSP